MAKTITKRGEPPSELEKNLLTFEPPPGTEVWVRIGRRWGAGVLAQLLDELGGTTVHVPKRQHLFSRLRRPALIVRARQMREAGAMWTEIAEEMGLPESTVRGLLPPEETPSAPKRPAPKPPTASDLRTPRNRHR